MPLSIFKRDAQGKILRDQNSGDELYESLPLDNEMAAEDFCVQDDLIGKVGLFQAWLKANFEQGILWVPESQDFDAFKIELADFLNEEIKGPYFVHQGFVNTRWTLDIIILKSEDRDRFAKAYPEWKEKPDAPQKNGETLKKWQEINRPMQDPSLFNYSS